MPYLGIEIGGTKLQLGIGDGNSRTLNDLRRANVEVELGAQGIVDQIESLGEELRSRHDLAGIGIGFGGPVDPSTGRVTKSHQIHGWEGFPLRDHLEARFGLPVALDNDCNVAALAEAKLGAGRHASRVFYVTVGSGIGGGFVVDGKVDGNHRPAISEIGHLRLGPAARSQETTVESVASGWGIARAARELVQQDASSPAAVELMTQCHGDIDFLTTKLLAVAAAEGNEIARLAMDGGLTALGWAIGQVVTLLAPEVVVVGGGVSLIGDTFFSLLRAHVNQFCFPPLRGAFAVLPAELGEEVVVHGAMLLASQQHLRKHAVKS